MFPISQKSVIQATNFNIIIYFISIFMLILPKLLAKYSGYRLDTEGGEGAMLTKIS